MPATFESMLENGSSADVVAKVVLNAVISEKSHVFKKHRYISHEYRCMYRVVWSSFSFENSRC